MIYKTEHYIIELVEQSNIFQYVVISLLSYQVVARSELMTVIDFKQLEKLKKIVNNFEKHLVDLDETN